MNGTPPVTLCIINHNGARHLPGAFAALRQQTWPFAEVLLVDDASEDDSLAIARTEWPALRVVALARNGGPGAARNAGLAAATHDLVLFQDNDIRLDAHAAARLVEFSCRHPQAFVVAPRVVHELDPGRVQFDSADCHFLGHMHTRNAEAPCAGLDSTPTRTTSMVSACFLLNRLAWDGRVRFDETLGFNLEDHDFGVRACVSGHELWVQPAARVLHGSGTPGLSYRPGGRPSAERLFYLTANRWIVIARCFATRTLVLLAPALFAYELAQFAWLASEGRSGVWWRAVRTVFARRRSLRMERDAIQRGRRLGDRSLLRDLPLPLTAYARSRPSSRGLVPLADAGLRAYWRLVRRWVAA